MSKVDFYSFFASPPCRAVHIFMEANKIPFEYHNVDLVKGKVLYNSVSLHGKKFQNMVITLKTLQYTLVNCDVVVPLAKFLP